MAGPAPAGLELGASASAVLQGVAASTRSVIVSQIPMAIEPHRSWMSMARCGCDVVDGSRLREIEVVRRCADELQGKSIQARKPAGERVSWHLIGLLMLELANWLHLSRGVTYYGLEQSLILSL